jgi:hypothetical protein
MIGLYFDRSPQAFMAQIANFGLPPLLEGYLTNIKFMEVIFFVSAKNEYTLISKKSFYL